MDVREFLAGGAPTGQPRSRRWVVGRVEERALDGWRVEIRATIPVLDPATGITYETGENTIRVEQELGDGWTAIYWIGLKEGIPIVRDIGITTNPGFPAGLAIDNTFYPAPQRPLSGRLLSNVSPSRALALARELLAEQADGLLAQHGLDRDSVHAAQPHRPGRRGRGAAWWASIAERYVTAVERGSTAPLADVRAQLSAQGGHFGEHYVRDAIKRARRDGLLTGTAPGQVGDPKLTAKGRNALDER